MLQRLPNLNSAKSHTKWNPNASALKTSEEHASSLQTLWWEMNLTNNKVSARIYWNSVRTEQEFNTKFQFLNGNLKSSKCQVHCWTALPNSLNPAYLLNDFTHPIHSYPLQLSKSSPLKYSHNLTNKCRKSWSRKYWSPVAGFHGTTFARMVPKISLWHTVRPRGQGMAYLTKQSLKTHPLPNKCNTPECLPLSPSHDCCKSNLHLNQCIRTVSYF